MTEANFLTAVAVPMPMPTPLTRRVLRPLLTGVVTLGVVTSASLATAAEPPPEMGTTDVAPATALEEAVQQLAQPIARRLGVRAQQGCVDLWLFSSATWDQVGEEMRTAVSSRRSLAGKFTLDRWTYVEPDHSYVADVLGGSKPYKVRLTKHLKGALVEVIDAGEASDAPRWSPTWRQTPVMFPHGAMR